MSTLSSTTHPGSSLFFALAVALGAGCGQAPGGASSETSGSSSSSATGSSSSSGGVGGSSSTSSNSGSSSSSGGGGASATSSSTSSNAGASSSGGSSCDPDAWVYMGTNANACVGNAGEPCGWTTTNEGQGYTCQTVSWGTGCEPGGAVCPGGGSTSVSSSSVASSSSSSSSGTAAGGLASILSEAEFDGFFPDRNSFYTYQGLVAATAMYPTFASSGNATADAQEVAAFLANVAHETGSLVYIDEIAQAPYCMSEAGCGCGGGEYYGRGPLQISWNYNYCAAGTALGVDLVDNPDLVSTDATITWQTALWFWMTSTGAGSDTCHSAIDSGAGFGETIQIINGDLECNGGEPADVQDRVMFYEQFCGTLGVSPGNNLTC